MPRSRKRKEEEPENLERWLVSYADFVTLLFAFFVVMYAISSVNEGKYRVLSETMVDAFSDKLEEPEGKLSAPLQTDEQQEGRFLQRKEMVTEEPQNTEDEFSPSSPVEDHSEDKNAFEQSGPAETEPVDDRLWVVASNLDSSLQGFVDQELVDIKLQGDKIEVQLNNKMLFGSGSARLSADARKAFKDIATIVKPLKNQIFVEGHTDNVPIKTLEFPSNWELSASRAASVVNYMSRQGIDPTRFAAIGYGEHKPVADNATEEGRGKNRRVLLIIRSQGGENPYGELQKSPAEPEEELPWAEAPGGG